MVVENPILSKFLSICLSQSVCLSISLSVSVCHVCLPVCLFYAFPVLSSTFPLILSQYKVSGDSSVVERRRTLSLSVCLSVCLFYAFPVLSSTFPLILSQYKVSGDSSVAERRRTRDQKVSGSSPGRIIFFSRDNFLCWFLFRYPFHPCVVAIARKRSRLFC